MPNRITTQLYNFEIPIILEIAVQYPIATQIIPHFHRQICFDNFEIRKNAVSPRAATIIRHMGGGESLYSQSIFSLIPNAGIVDLNLLRIGIAM